MQAVWEMGYLEGEIKFGGYFNWKNPVSRPEEAYIWRMNTMILIWQGFNLVNGKKNRINLA